MCFYYDEYCSVWNVTTPKARKEHKCYECRQPIRPGETYSRISYVFDGTAGTYKECARCETVRAKVAEIEKARGCEGSEAWCPMGELAAAITEDSDHYGMLRRDNETDIDYVLPEAAHLFPEAEVVTAL